MCGRVFWRDCSSMGPEFILTRRRFEEERKTRNIVHRNVAKRVVLLGSFNIVNVNTNFWPRMYYVTCNIYLSVF